MTYKPNPLSVRYEAAAGAFLGKAIADRGKWKTVVVARPSPGPRSRAWLRAHGIALDRLDAGGLTAYERAYQQALYRTAKRLGISVPFQRNPRWSLQREWGPVTARGRQLGIRVSPADAARRAVQRKPKGEQWWRNPELRSGGQGSGQERFG